MKTNSHIKPALPDVNVLIALLDPNHQFHELAHAWFEADQRPRRGTGRRATNPSGSPAHVYKVRWLQVNRDGVSDRLRHSNSPVHGNRRDGHVAAAAERRPVLRRGGDAGRRRHAEELRRTQRSGAHFRRSRGKTPQVFLARCDVYRRR
ncbi:MAG: hypothetical protein EBY17_14810 [Acidobacteriia bacterium]|nr:hypothetical protein [Terriglobia bacterium]